MRYCVIKDTVTVIDGSSNNDNIMLKNALNCDFTASQVEILTQAEFDARKELETQSVPEPTLEKRLAVAEETINFLLGL